MDKRKQLLPLTGILILMILLIILITGMVQAIKRGNGFLFIPSFTASPTASFTHTITPTTTLTPVDTIDLMRLHTSIAQTIDSNHSKTEAAKTKTLTPTSTLTPVNTVDMSMMETKILFAFLEAQTETAEAIVYTATPSMILNEKGYFEKRKGNDQSIMVRIQEAGKTFWIDKYEVTCQQYSLCVNMGKCDRVPQASEDDDQNLPVVNVNWNQAAAYCLWAGKHLITDSEWLTGAGILFNTEYPWGNDSPDQNRVNANLFLEKRVKPGQYPSGMSPFGLMDMLGNVWEWTESSDNLEEQKIRGGSWRTPNNLLGLELSGKMKKTESSIDVGFRCASSQ